MFEGEKVEALVNFGCGGPSRLLGLLDSWEWGLVGERGGEVEGRAKRRKEGGQEEGRGKEGRGGVGERQEKWWEERRQRKEVIKGMWNR